MYGKPNVLHHHNSCAFRNIDTGFLPEDPRGAAAHRQYAEQYSEQSSSDDGYLNMDDSISLSAAIAATSK